ncbi:UNVERIFIED_CONTAM: hypothetical protein K2H54_009110 [Gekko kuhli]
MALSITQKPPDFKAPPQKNPLDLLIQYRFSWESFKKKYMESVALHYPDIVLKVLAKEDHVSIFLFFFFFFGKTKQIHCNRSISPNVWDSSQKRWRLNTCSTVMLVT